MKPKTYERVVEVLKAHGKNSMLKIGTLKNIARQAEIAESEF